MTIGPDWTEAGTCPVLGQAAGQVHLTVADLPPASDAGYHLVTTGRVFPVEGDGKLWARASHGTAELVVTALTGGTEGPT